MALHPTWWKTVPLSGWHLLCASLFMAPLLGCGGLAGESVGQLSLAIVGGQPATNAAVVALNGCTGTLIAPRVVLTARHCVTSFKGGGPFECTEQGTLYVNPDAPFQYVGAGELAETLPPETFVVGPNTPESPRVQAIFVSSGGTMCEGDVAVLVLDRSVDDGRIAPLRLDQPVRMGESLTSMGYGQHEGGNGSTTLLARSVTVTALGPQPRQPDVADGLAPGFFSTTEGPCRGDSGSAAFSVQGAAVGVASSVGRPDLQTPTGTVSDCVGSRAVFDTIARHAALIESSLATAGARPWREGEPDPTAQLKEFEQPCTTDSDCQSQVCVVHDDGQARCSHGCIATACPEKYECRQLPNRKRCVWSPPPPSPNPSNSTSSSPPMPGCSAGGADLHAWLPWLLAPWCATRRRRRVA